MQEYKMKPSVIIKTTIGYNCISLTLRAQIRMKLNELRSKKWQQQDVVQHVKTAL